MTNAQLDALHRLTRPKLADHKPDPQRTYGLLCGMALAVRSNPAFRGE